MWRAKVFVPDLQAVSDGLVVHVHEDEVVSLLQPALRVPPRRVRDPDAVRLDRRECHCIPTHTCIITTLFVSSGTSLQPRCLARSLARSLTQVSAVADEVRPRIHL